MFRFVIFLVAFLVASVPGLAAMVDVEAENVQKKDGRVEAFGNVLASGENFKLKANYVIYDTATDDLWAAGDCKLQEKAGEISAESLYYNVKRKDVRLENGTVFIYAQPVIISGRSITRYGMDQFEGEGVDFTPCLGVPPAWSLGMGSFEAPLEKYGNATHVKFKIHDIPVFYFPYLYFPVKLQRQSGFLIPSAGHSTDYGYQAGVPYYQVLGHSADATMTPNILTDRGLLMTGEFRYRLDTEQYGEVYGELLPRDAKGGDEKTGMVLDEVPDSRWLFRSFQKGGDLFWDVKLVSTPDYFRDIGSLYPDQNVWQDTITTTTGVGRGLEQLVSRGQWVKHPDGFTTDVSGMWTQDLTVQSNSQTLQEIPRANLRMNQRDIPGLPGFVSSQLDASYVYSRDWVQEFRDEGQVGFFFPLGYNPYFTITPSYTQYYRDAHITSNPGGFQDATIQNLWNTRDPSLTSYYTNPEFLAANPGLFQNNNYLEVWQKRALTLTTSLYSGRFLNGLYHQMTPIAEWTYFSRQGGNYDSNDPEDIYPQLLPGDVWQQENQLSLGVGNYIRDYTGRALAEVSLSRVYDYLLNQWDFYEANIVFNPVPWFSVRHLNRFGVEPHPYATIEHWTRLSLHDSNDDELYASEEYRNPDTETGIIGTVVNPGFGLSLRYEASYDFLDNRYIRTRQEITYTAQCWYAAVYRDIDTSDENLPRNTSIGFRINLLGLGQSSRPGQGAGARGWQ